MQQRISDWAKKFKSVVAPCDERPDKPSRATSSFLEMKWRRW